MAGREMEEAELLNNKRVADTLKKMLAHPEARRMVLSAQKIVEPEVIIPEMDMEERVQKAMTPLHEEVTSLKKRLEAQDAQLKAEAETNKFTEKWEADKKRVRKVHGFTDDGIAAIEKLCEDRGIPDFEAGAALFEKLNPAKPIDTSSTEWNFFGGSKDGDDFVKQLIETRGQNDRVVDEHVNRTLLEIRAGH